MLPPRVLHAFEAGLPPTAVREPHREPTPPPGRPRDLREGHRLAHLPLLPQAAGPVLPFDDPGLARLRAQPGQDVFPPGLPREGAACHPLAAPPFLGLFPLTRGPALGPAQDEARPAALPSEAGRGVPVPQGFHEGGRLAARSGSEHRWSMPGAQAALGGMDEGRRLRWGPFAHDETHHEGALRCHSGGVPPIASPLLLVALAPRLLVFTQLQGSSNASALGVRACPC